MPSLSPVLKASTKNCDDAFLAGHGCALPSSCWGYKKLRFYWICDQKTDEFFDLQSKINSTMMNCIFGCPASTQNVPHCPSWNSPDSMYGQGHVVSLRGLTLNCSQQTPTLILQAVALQTPVESWRETQISPIRLTLWQCTISWLIC